MTDMLKRLRRAMARNPAPKPRPEARARARQAALAAFDAAAQDFSPSTQGSTGEARPRSDRATGPGDFLRRTAMTLTDIRLKPALLGGASIAVVALALIATQTERRGDIVDAIDATLNDAPLDDAPVAPRPPARSDTARPEAPEADARLNDARLAAEPPRLAAEEPAAGPAPQPAPRRALAETEADAAATSGPAVRLRQSKREQPRSEATGALVGGLNASGQATAAAPAESRAYAPAMPAPHDVAPAPGYRDQGRDRFQEIEDNPVRVAAEEPVSTFSIDVDTASYSFMRRAIMEGVLPQKDAVRIEELVNYFPYDYAPPETAETPFRAHLAVTPTPWNAETKLIRIGIKGYEIAAGEAPPANLVFLIDTSGSMNAPDKLPLLLNSFRLLLERLDGDDTVSIVAYAGSAGTVLEPTEASEKSKILDALERLAAGGSTAGGEGIRQAYRLAEANFDRDAVNRVILATDGDFNVGITDRDELQGFVERKRETGVYLSVLGFGRGNLNDALMQALAQNGNGQAAYIDTLSEARKVMVEEAGSTLFPIAEDVKIQVEFNPATVAEYRLIGYETRQLAREDFNNDAVDAGEIGAGHAVTALYEITPTGSQARLVDDLRYGEPAAAEGPDDEYGFLKIRYKRPGEDESTLITRPITTDLERPIDAPAMREARFAAAVAGFGQLLRGGRYTGEWDYDDAAALAQSAKGADPFGYRAEFVTLVRLAETAADLERQRR